MNMNISKNPATSSNSRQISETPLDAHKYSTCISESKYLPPEICTQIFTKLPAKSLLRFRCVCRSWCSIIDHPDFVDMHLKSCNNNSGNNLLVALEVLGRSIFGALMLTVREDDTFQKTSQIFTEYTFNLYHIVGNCNGLLLVNRKDSICVSPDELRLWNPSIRKSLILPAIPFPRSLISTIRYLFGFAPDSKDYKVVALIFGISFGDFYSAVYTLRYQQWTVINTRFNVTLPNTFRGGYGLLLPVSTTVSFQGAAYWLGQNDKETHLCSFDFDKEIITVFGPTFSLDETGTLRFLFLLGESLAIFCISGLNSSIWVLEQDNVKWPWNVCFRGKSSPEGCELFEYCNHERQKIIYRERNGRYYFYCGNKSYDIVSCRVFTKLIASRVQLETYSESLVLFKGYGARYLGDFL